MSQQNYNVSFDQLMPALNSRRYDQNFTNIPNGKLPPMLRQQLGYFLEFVGVELKDDESCLAVLAESGSFKRLFCPTLFRVKTSELRALCFDAHVSYITGGDDDYVVGIKWAKDRFIPIQAFVDRGATIEFTERTATITLPEKEGFEDGLSYEMPLFLLDLDNPPRPSDLSRALKKGNLWEYLNDAPKGSNAVKMTELPENSTHRIIGYSVRESQYGQMYLLLREDKTQIMANKPIESVLKANPTISPEKPATLYVSIPTKMKNGKMRVPATLQVAEGAFSNDNGFSLDW